MSKYTSSVIPILEYRKSGLYALINHQDKKYMLGYAQNVLVALDRLVKDCIEIVRDADRIDLVVEDMDKSIAQRHLCVMDQEYRNLGYSSYRNIRGLKLILRTEVAPDFRDPSKMLLYCVLIQKNNDKEVVGVFNSKAEADLFVQDYNPPFYPYKAWNKLTSRYLEKYKY